jgi:hypothetical protein
MLSDLEYKRRMRMNFVRLNFTTCSHCNSERTLLRDVRTNEVRCFECSYVMRKADVVVSHVSASECSYDAKSIAARLIARAKLQHPLRVKTEFNNVISSAQKAANGR